jgi:hypothetical protein
VRRVDFAPIARAWGTKVSGLPGGKPYTAVHAAPIGGPSVNGSAIAECAANIAAAMLSENRILTSSLLAELRIERL